MKKKLNDFIDRFRKPVIFETEVLPNSSFRNNKMMEEVYKRSQEMTCGVVLGEVKEQTPEQQHINSITRWR